MFPCLPATKFKKYLNNIKRCAPVTSFRSIRILLYREQTNSTVDVNHRVLVFWGFFLHRLLGKNNCLHVWAPAGSVKVMPKTLPSAAPLFTRLLLLAANKRRQCFLPCFSRVIIPFESVFIVEISYRLPCALYRELECFL